MRRADISPCNNLPYIYGFIDKSVFETMLNTCKNIDNPPKPRKREKKRRKVREEKRRFPGKDKEAEW